MIDSLLFGWPLIAWAIAEAVTNGGADRVEATFGGFSPLTLGLVFGYLVMETAFTTIAGGTPGKLILGIRVVDPASGAWPTPARSLARVALITAAGRLPFSLGFLLLVAPALRDPASRTIHDRVARTVVVGLTSGVAGDPAAGHPTSATAAWKL